MNRPSRLRLAATGTVALLALTRRHAIRFVASRARNAVDAALLLDALGLTAAEGLDGKEAVA